MEWAGAFCVTCSPQWVKLTVPADGLLVAANPWSARPGRARRWRGRRACGERFAAVVAHRADDRRRWTCHRRSWPWRSGRCGHLELVRHLGIEQSAHQLGVLLVGGGERDPLAGVLLGRGSREADDFVQAAALPLTYPAEPTWIDDHVLLGGPFLQIQRLCAALHSGVADHVEVDLVLLGCDSSARLGCRQPSWRRGTRLGQGLLSFGVGRTRRGRRWRRRPRAASRSGAGRRRGRRRSLRLRRSRLPLSLPRTRGAPWTSRGSIADVRGSAGRKRGWAARPSLSWV